VAWLFLCQTKAYFSYPALLSQGRWVAMGAVGLLGVLAAFRARKKVRTHPWWIMPLLLAPYLLLSATWSIEPDLTIERSASMMLLWGAVFGVVRFALSSPQLILGTIKAIVLPLVCLFWGLLPIYGFDLSYVEKGYLRSAGAMVNPNAAGIMGAFLWPAAYYLWRVSDKRRSVWLFATATLGFMVLISGSRGALAATLVAIAALILQGKRTKGTLGLAVAMVAIGCGVALGVIGVPEVVERYLRVENLEVLGGRRETWPVVWAALGERPFSGYGFGTEEYIFEYVGASFSMHSGAMVHNSYLGFALQVGLLGALLLFLPLVYVAGTGAREGMASSDQRTAALVASVMAALVIAMTESWIYSAGNALALPFWTFFGLLAGMLARRQKLHNGIRKEAGDFGHSVRATGSQYQNK